MRSKDRLQDYLHFCLQNSLSLKAFWKQFRESYFVTSPKDRLQEIEMKKVRIIVFRG